MTENPTTHTGDAQESAGLVRDLQRVEAYSEPIDEIGFLQTHISWLFFAGQRVYKVKKPVDLGFLDFTTLELRRHYCEEEVRLNRRLAPQVYLGVVPITRGADGQLTVNGDGEALEWAVEMVRLPENRMLSNLLERGEIDNELMNAMASSLSKFHAECATGSGVDEYGTLEVITANAEENYDQLREYVADVDQDSSSGLRVLSPNQHAFLQSRGRKYLTEHKELFERRIREQRIREGHGDLHAGNLCFTAEGLIAYDCIEFSRRFRCGDVAADLGFLAMDLDYRGYPGFSKYLVRMYRQIAGDSELPTLENFYKGYRALVRSKVAAMTAINPAIVDAKREELRREAMRYAQLAAAYELPPAMILMCGLPACGKSWLAKRLAGSLRAAVLRSDARRKLLSATALTQHVHVNYETELYSQGMKQKTYRALLEHALGNLRSGHSVIVDATFSKKEFRCDFVDAAARLDLPYYVVHVTASDSVIRERLIQRENEKRALSDAGLDVYLREKESFEPPTEVPQSHVLEVVSGEGPPEEQSSIVIDRMIAGLA